MPDTGYRSVEVSVTNDTQANLTVQGVVAEQGSWIQGETPTQGDELAQYNSVKWGISTDDYNGAAQGQVSLTGMGSYPVMINFENDSSDNTTCTVTPNDEVTGTATKTSSGEANHAEWTVQLTAI